MPEPSLSAFAILLRPFVTSVARHIRRLHAERRAGQMSLSQPSPIVDELLNRTLDRVRGGNIDSGWWQTLLDRFGQRYVAPDILRKPALQEWLAEESVADDLKAIATVRIMSTAEEEAALRDRLAQSYSSRTGEAVELASGPVEVVVAILVASYIAPIPADQLPVAGMVQAGFARTDDRLDRLTQSISSLIDPITREAHTERASKELARILTLRAVNPVKSRSDVQGLQRRFDGGDLAAADEGIKNTVRYWVARLYAGDSETLKVARELREEIRNDDPDMDLSIVDALFAEADGDPNGAIQLLRDRDDADSRTALFGLIARARGSAKALEMYLDRIDAGDAELFTAVGWRMWAGCTAEVGKWEEAAQRLAGLDGNRSFEPALALMEGIINAQLLLPAEMRSITSDPQLFVGITPIHGKQAKVAHERATTCFQSAQVGLEEIEEVELSQSVADWQRWLRLMDPKAENASAACDNVRQNLESDSPDINLTLFAWAFGVSFDPEPLRRYLVGREKLGGLNEDELRAQCLIFWNLMNSGEMKCRRFLDYLGDYVGKCRSALTQGAASAGGCSALSRAG